MCVKCGNNYWQKRDEEFPFVVRFGKESESFETESEARKFLSELHNARLDRRPIN